MSKNVPRLSKTSVFFALTYTEKSC